MAIEFEFRGEWYRVDTPQEVVELKKYLRAHAQEEEGSSSDLCAGVPAHGKWTGDLFGLLMEKIGYFEKKFLAVLLSVSHPIDANTVSGFLPIPVRENKRRRKAGWESLLFLAGIQSGLVRHVRALGLGCPGWLTWPYRLTSLLALYSSWYSPPFPLEFLS